MNEAQTRKDLIDPAIEATGSGFLCLDAAEDGLLEVSRSAEKLVLGRGHGELVGEFLLDQAGRTDQVGNLEEFVSDGFDALGEFNGRQKARRENLENISDGNRFSSLKAKNILRFSVIPSLGKTSPISIANSDRFCKWEDKMKAGIAPRPQRRLLRLPVTPELPFVAKYYCKNLDCAQEGMAA